MGQIIIKGTLLSSYLEMGWDDMLEHFIEIKSLSKEPLKTNVKKVALSIKDYRKTLVMGEVQSGKTFLLTALIAMVFYFDIFDLVLFFADNTNKIKEQNMIRMKNDLKYMNLSETVYSIKGSDLKKLASKKKLLFVMIKQPDVYKNLTKYWESYKNRKILIINDEGDDTNPSKKITNYLNKFSQLGEKVKMLYLTATPFRNLSKEGVDNFISLESPKTYFGIFSEWNYENNFLKQIKLKKKDIAEWNDKAHAVVRYYYYQWLKHIDENNLEKSAFLINIHSIKMIHRKTHNLIHYGLKNPEFFAKALIRDGGIFDNEDKIVFLLKKYKSQILVINSDNAKESDREIKKNYAVVIGGKIISRGLTVKDLGLVLMLNSPKTITDKIHQYAILLQRARWFGHYDELGEKKEKVKIVMYDEDIERLKEIQKLVNLTKSYKVGKSKYNDYLKSKGFN